MSKLQLIYTAKSGEDEAEKDKEEGPDGHADDDLDDAHFSLGHLLLVVFGGAILNAGDDDADSAENADTESHDGKDDV